MREFPKISSRRNEFYLSSHISMFYTTVLCCILFIKVLHQQLWKFSLIAWSYYRNMTDYLFGKKKEKNSQEIKSASTEFGVNSKCDLYWWTGLVEQATSTKKSDCWWCCQGWYKSRLLHAINFWSYGEVRSEAATGTSPTETLGGWGTLHPSKQLSLPRGQHQQYPIHYKEQRKKEGGKQGREKKQQTFIYCHRCHLFHHFFHDLRLAPRTLRWIDWVRWV